MEEDLDEVANGSRAWVPVVREFYTPFQASSSTARPRSSGRSTSDAASDEVCSEGHPMVIRLGRYGEFLACSLYPEHKETRPLGDRGRCDGGAGRPAAGGAAGRRRALPRSAAPTEGGTLVARRGRFGPFIGCTAIRTATTSRRTARRRRSHSPFEVACPTCHKGHLVTRRARRTGSLFWGCSRYPKCDFTTSHEPLGALHDADDGPVARNGESARSASPAARRSSRRRRSSTGARMAGGPPNPEALARPGRRGRSAAGGRSSSGAKSRGSGGATTSARARPTRRPARRAEPTSGA